MHARKVGEKGASQVEAYKDRCGDQGVKSLRVTAKNVTAAHTGGSLA